MTHPRPITHPTELASLADQILLTRNRLLQTGQTALAEPLERALYGLNYLSFTAMFGTRTPPGTTPHGHGPPPPRVLTRIQILDPDTRRPQWVQHWTGFQLTTHWSGPPDRPSLTPAQSLRARGGNIFDEQWEADLHKWPPVCVAPEIFESQKRAGLESLFLAPELPS